MTTPAERRSDPSQVLVRRATSADAGSLTVLLAEFLECGTQEIEARGNSVEEVLADANSVVLLATVEAREIAFVTLSIRRVIRYAEPIAEIDELYVMPSYRRNGVATALLEHAHQSAAARNCRRIFVASNNRRTAGHLIYQSMGYDRYGVHLRSALSPGSQRPGD